VICGGVLLDAGIRTDATAVIDYATTAMMINAQINVNLKFRYI